MNQADFCVIFRSLRSGGIDGIRNHLESTSSGVEVSGGYLQYLCEVSDAARNRYFDTEEVAFSAENLHRTTLFRYISFAEFKQQLEGTPNLAPEVLEIVQKYLVEHKS